MSCLYILEINSLLVALFANIFYSIGCLFLFTVSFAVQTLLSLIMSHLFIVFISITLGDGAKKILLQFMSKSILLMFSSRSFRVSGLTLRCLFWVYFCIWCEKMFWFHSFTCSCPVFPGPLTEETIFFSIEYSWFFCHRLIDHKCKCLFLGSLFCFIDLCVCFCASTILFWLL